MIFIRRAESAPPSEVLPPLPQATDIAGYLRACQDQTAEYDWNLILDAVQLRLGIPGLSM